MLEADDRLVEFAVRSEVAKKIVNAREIENMLVITFWERAELIKNIRRPHWCVFVDISGMDYITRDLSCGKLKWLTGCISRMGIMSYGDEDILFDQKESRTLMSEKFGYRAKYISSQQFKDLSIDKNVVRCFDYWQDDVIAQRRHKREMRELEYTDRMRMQKHTVKGWLQLARPPVNAKKYEKIEFYESVKVAIEAMEKATPKKPTLEGDGYAPDGTFVWDEWLCPHCSSRYELDYEDHDYCPNCGQAIDWSE